jgi:hypothetical protein
MPLFPLASLPWIRPQFLDADGNPLAGGRLYSYITGTVTPQPTYTDPDGDTPHTNPIELDSAGLPPSPIYLLPTGYKFVLDDADGVLIDSVDGIEDVGAAFAAYFGVVSAAGSKNVVSGYEILDSDRLVTVNSTGGPDPAVINLPAASEARQPVTIKNLGTVALAVTPNGTDVIEGDNAAFTVPAATDPIFPTISLIPDGVSAWWVQSSHGL